MSIRDRMTALVEGRNGSQATRDAVYEVLTAIKKWRAAVAEMPKEDRTAYISYRLPTDMGNIDYALSIVTRPQGSLS